MAKGKLPNSIRIIPGMIPQMLKHKNIPIATAGIPIAMAPMDIKHVSNPLGLAIFSSASHNDRLVAWM